MLVWGAQTGFQEARVKLVTKSQSHNHESSLSAAVQVVQISLTKNVFRHIIKIAEMVAGGNCGFRSMAHIITVENLCSLRSASIYWIISTLLQDTSAVFPSGEISLKSLQVA